MEVSTERKTAREFSWADLGDLQAGRPNLGPMAPVLVYRLLECTMRETLIDSYGLDAANEVFFKAGKLAGEQFCRNVLDTRLAFGPFVSQLRQTLKDLKIGLLRVEHADLDAWFMILTVAEDLDCSGLPVTSETVCVYDEGFIAGILEVYAGREFAVKEVDCWANGDRVCRFEVKGEGSASCKT